METYNLNAMIAGEIDNDFVFYDAEEADFEGEVYEDA